MRLVVGTYKVRVLMVQLVLGGLAVVADLGSVLGLLITGYVAWRVDAIRRGYMLMGRGPQLKEVLLEKANQLPELIVDVDANRQRILVGLGEVEVKLRSLDGFLDGELKHEARRLRGDARELRGLPRKGPRWWRSYAQPTGRPAPTYDSVFNLYNDVATLVDMMGEELENRRWSGAG